MLKSKKKQAIVIFSAIIFYVIFILMNDVNKFSFQWSTINTIYIPIILGLQFSVLIIRIFRQKILLDSVNIKISWKENIKVHLMGLTLIMTPGGLGQTIKSYYLKNNFDASYSKTVSVSLAERYHDLIGIVPIIFFLLLFREAVGGWIIGGIMTAILILIYIIIRNKNIVKTILKKIPQYSFLKKVSENHERIAGSLHTMTEKKVFLKCFGLDVLSWVVAAFPFYFVFKAFSLNIDFFDAVYISYIPIILGAISFIPGGLGITELSMLNLLLKYDVEQSVASSLILFSRITSIWFFTIIGVITARFLFRSSKDLRKSDKS